KAGKTMKQSAASWRKKSSTRKTRKSPKPKRSRKTTTKKKTTRKRASRLLGSIGLKGALIGGLTYFGVSRVMPPIGGVYAPAITKVATGLVAKSVGVPGAILTGAGAIEGAAILIEQLLAGQLALPFFGGNGGGARNGGYDF
ncbi:unnamed protein product, partial [marine sediment metagenome]